MLAFGFWVVGKSVCAENQTKPKLFPEQDLHKFDQNLIMLRHLQRCHQPKWVLVKGFIPLFGEKRLCGCRHREVGKEGAVGQHERLGRERKGKSENLSSRTV